MIINHLRGRSVADTDAMAALTGYPPAAIRHHCTREEHGYDVDVSEQLLKALPPAAVVNVPDPVLYTAAQAQEHLGIPAGTVRQWALRGRLKSTRRDFRGNPLYDVRAIVDLHGKWCECTLPHRPGVSFA